MTNNSKFRQENGLYFELSHCNPHLLEGLEKWLQLGLLSETEIKQIAKNDLKCDTQYCLGENIFDHPQILEGLEIGLQLGLIRDEKVKQIAQTYLVSSWHYVISETLDQSIISPSYSPIKQQNVTIKETTSLPLSSPPLLVKFFQSLKEELSVGWLLFLGLFLVILSSAVLAASQWNKFPTFAQYWVLLSYTLIFWQVGFYFSKQQDLKLTSHTLQCIALLLIPVNFWAIDTFGLWQSLWGSVVAIVGIFLLMGMVVISNKEKSYLPLVINFIGLSLCHLGWEIQGLSLIVVYLGMIATAINLRFILPRQVSTTLEKKSLTLIKPSFVSYGLAIILIRAIFVAQIPLIKLGLAIATCGWLFTLEALDKNGLNFIKNNQENSAIKIKSPSQQSLEIIGAIFMAMGWVITVTTLPLQAFLISGFALHWLGQRLTTYWRKRELFWLFMIGLQTLILIRNIVPENLKETALNFSVEFAQSAPHIYTVYGITLFPYIILFICLTGYLYQQDKKELARFGEYLTLSLGLVLIIISFPNPVWRSLNLLLSSLTLIYLNFRHQNQVIFLIYCTQITGILTLISGLYWLVPILRLREGSPYWQIIFSALIILELTLSVIPFQLKNIKQINQINQEKILNNGKIWFNSCWYFGLIFVGITHYLLIEYTLNDISSLSSTIHLGQKGSFLIPLTLTGVSIFTKNKRRETGAIISLISLFLLQITNIWYPPLRVVNLIFTTIIFFINSRLVSQDQEIQTPLTYFNNFFALTALLSIIHYLLPNLTTLPWLLIFLILNIGEWLLYLLSFKQKINPDPENNDQFYLLKFWGESGWYFGCILALIIYSLFWYELTKNIDSHWLLGWAIIPVNLTFIAFQSPSNLRKKPVILSAITLGLLVILTLWFLPTRIFGLLIAIALMLFNVKAYPNYQLTQLHWFFIISLVIGSGWEYFTLSHWFIVASTLSLILWFSAQILQKNQKKLTLLYSKSAQQWGSILNNLTLITLTYRYAEISNYNQYPNYDTNYLISMVILGGAFLISAKENPCNATIYKLAWLTELTIIESISLVKYSTFNLALANVIISLIILVLSSHFAPKFPRFSNLISWKILPLLFALIALILKAELFNTYTGLLVIGASITGIGVSIRQKEWKWITYFSLGGITLGAYELVIYQLLQSNGSSLADGITIIALVTGVIALCYKLFVFFVYLRGKNYIFNLRLQELNTIAHFHWGLASILNLITVGIALNNQPQLTYLSLALNFFLGVYALNQGRANDPEQLPPSNDWWVYVGLVEIVATCVYARLIITNLRFIDPFQALIVVLVALFIYQIPWQELGWKETPWHRFALVSPALIALTSSNKIEPFSLIFVAIFYGRIALRQKNIRWTYLSLGFIDWAIFLLLKQWVLKGPLWFISVISLSILYLAQFDPELIKPNLRQNRHYLRILGGAFLGVSALILHREIWLIPITISLVFIFFGLGSKIRAFLYVGTILFLLTNFYHLIILINESSLSKWIIGFVTGICLIVVAAIFERKKETIFETIQTWFEQLQIWE